MKKTIIIPLTIMTLAATACQQGGSSEENPLLTTPATPYGAPQFDKIKTEHYEPAFDVALAEARADEARLALAAHQVNALSQGQDKEDRTAALNTEIARLESEQDNILVQIAGCQAKLEAHETRLRKLAAGQDSSIIS